MGGGLMQIITYGTQDLTLTGNPEITFFNVVYRRYTNFGKRFVTVSFDNSSGFNMQSIVDIPKNMGDLMTKMILKIKLPRVDLTTINQLITERLKQLEQQTNTNNIVSETYFTYYNYFIEFFTKLKNIIRVFFNKYDLKKNSITYIQDLSTYILKFFNLSEYSQFFYSIEFYLNDNQTVGTKGTFPIETFTNASLYKIQANNLIYIYEQFTSQTVSYGEFKFLINKNMEILDSLNVIMYNKMISVGTSAGKNTVQFAWVNKIGIWLFDSIDLYIGSNKIYSLSDTYVNNYSEIYYKNRDLFNSMVGNEQEINQYSVFHEESFLYLPIPFWNYANCGLAFPLIALQFNSLQLKINTKKFLDCIRIDLSSFEAEPDIKNEVIGLLSSFTNTINNQLNISLLLELVYLDKVERAKFAQSAHEYLIEQVQEITFNNIGPFGTNVNSNHTSSTLEIDAFHCCKDLMWFVKKNVNPLDIFLPNIDVFNYTFSMEQNYTLRESAQNFIKYVRLLTNSNQLFDLNIFLYGLNVVETNIEFINDFNFVKNYYSNVYNYPSENSSLRIILMSSMLSLNGTQLIGENFMFYNYLQTWNYYNATPQHGLNLYSFSLKPTEFQPSGACNFSKITFFGMEFKYNPLPQDLLMEKLGVRTQSQPGDASNKYELIVQLRNYNILRLFGGIGATAFTY